MKKASHQARLDSLFSAASKRAQARKAASVAVGDHLPCLQLINRAAIRTLGLTGLGHVQIHLGVGVPELHVGLGAGAEHTALRVQVFGQQFNSCVAHVRVPQTLVSQWAYLGLRPLTMSKNALWIFSVIGPRLPMPICTRSSSRIGVTSAAVPVKKASSAMYTSSRVMRFCTMSRPRSLAMWKTVLRVMPFRAPADRSGV